MGWGPIGGIVSAATSLADMPGKLAESVSDAVLPKELEFVGDAIHLGVSLYEGDYMGATGAALNLLGADDAKGRVGGQPGSHPALPDAMTKHVSSMFEAVIESFNKQLAESNPQVVGKPVQAQLNVADSGLTRVKTKAEPQPEAASGTHKAASKSSASGTPASESKVETSSDNKTASTDASSKTGTDKNVVDDFLNLSPDELKNRVREGNIPPEVFKSDGGMLRLQTKLQDISQMNNLLTQLMSAMHQMNMAVIQNIRA